MVRSVAGLFRLKCVLPGALYLVLLPQLAHAENVVARQVDLPLLAKHATWLKLLHYGESGSSEIRSSQFFLSPRGATDPLAELQATLDALAQPWAEDPNAHPRCRYPARYHWLSRQMTLPDYRDREPRCQRLEQWARFDDLSSVSLYLVSGYFGNPASTFGHALMKFNAHGDTAGAALMDISINFGAAVPDGESTLRYVIKGVFGGYKAGFSDKFHFTNDTVYGHNEFRDMWDYRLNLPAEQRDFLVKHVAEVAGNQFDYFFLTENCGLRLKQLLEVVLDQPLGGQPFAWYAPVELFHAIEQHRLPSGEPLSAAARFVPSAERVLLQRLAELSEGQRVAARRMVANRYSDLVQDLSRLPMTERLAVLDTLLAYQAYRITAAGDEVPPEERAHKNRLLLARLALPPNREARAREVPEVLSPALGHAPMLTELGVVSAAHGASTKLRWAPYFHELNGFHSLEDSELAVMDLDVEANGDGLRLTRFDLLRVRKLATRGAGLESTSWSWQVQAGYRALPTAGQRQRDAFASGGVGKAGRFGELTAFLVANASIHSKGALAVLTPEVGIYGGKERWRWTAIAARSYRVADGRPLLSRSEVELKLGWRVEKDLVVSASLRGGTQGGAKVSVQRYW